MNQQSSVSHPGRYRWLAFVFTGILILDQFFVLFELQEARYASKSLLMPTLMAYFWLSAGSTPAMARTLILTALFFSWLGDVLLLLEPHDNIFFILGLSAFLIAHIFYIIYFEKWRREAGAPFRPIILLPVLAWYAILMFILTPSLGDLLIPVWIYGAVICLMLALAWQVQAGLRIRATLLAATGASYFVVSDSVLAVNKFYTAIPLAGVIVMFTYALAQMFIVTGALLRHLQPDERNR
jgi:uncharacterized membrane protein YhhN